MATASTVDADFGPSAAKADGKKPGGRLQCVVVTPERTLFDELVEFVALPLYDGELGVLPGRSPMLGRLGFGELRTKAQGTTRPTCSTRKPPPGSWKPPKPSEEPASTTGPRRPRRSPGPPA
jgi:ATP synthase, Delta/Epsilon chain, beta-sandwich domain